MGAFDYDAAVLSGFFEVLGDLFPDGVSARLLLEKFGVRAAEVMPFGGQAPTVYWQVVGRDVDQGRYPAGLDALLLAALTFYPRNSRLLAIRTLFGIGVQGPVGTKVLLLMAEPWDSGRTLLGAELQAVQEEVNPAGGFELSVHAAVRPADIIDTLLDTWPHIVHLSGHGDPFGVFSAQTDAGATAPVELSALLGTVDRLDSVRLVILGACHLAPESEWRFSIIHHEGKLPSAVAVEFARGFYRALVTGQDLAACFGFGQSEVKLAGHDPSGFRLVPGRDGAA